jgi:ABC-type transport system involved in cytochrome bd biosynthesis fused ATPase/permease subunit
MSGIYKPSKGDVLINTDRFAYVGPDPLIFSDTLRNNLIYALDEAIDDSLLLEKLEKFKIFESEEEKNLDRLVSSKTLSSGQMQKISCIRSLIRNPDILFLDEATANLDKDSVKILNNELINFKGTIVNITHKQEHFSNIDSIYIINARNLIKSE